MMARRVRYLCNLIRIHLTGSSRAERLLAKSVMSRCLMADSTSVLLNSKKNLQTSFFSLATGVSKRLKA